MMMRVFHSRQMLAEGICLVGFAEGAGSGATSYRVTRQLGSTDCRSGPNFPCGVQLRVRFGTTFCIKSLFHDMAIDFTS